MMDLKVIYSAVKHTYFAYVHLVVRRLFRPEMRICDYRQEGGCSKAEVLDELNYFLGPRAVGEICPPGLLKRILFTIGGVPIVVFGRKYHKWDRIWLNEFDVDHKLFHTAAWSWHQLSTYISDESRQATDPRDAFKRFKNLKDRLSKLKKAYVFGTGPSLLRCLEMDFTDGIRIACNTMVKSDTIWEKICPHMIVAGDAIHHFSNTKYAINFRTDLRRRLEQDPKLVFLFPSDFYPFLMREIPHLKGQLIPMSYGSHTDCFRVMDGKLVTPANDNVLTMLELPLAANLSRTIMFLGFDGRGKADTGFWNSSEEYNYIAEMPELRIKYPAFFHNALEKDADKASYVKKVHGELLDNSMEQAEANGYRLYSLASSNTLTFEKRYQEYLLIHEDR